MEHRAFQYTFFGKVFPERANVNVAPPLEFEIRQVEANLSGNLKIFIGASQITAIFSTPKEIDNIYTLENYVEDIIRLEVDIIGYLNGCGYDVEITGVIDPLSNETVIFGVGIGELESQKENRPKKFDEILALFVDYKGDYLRRCLSDLREAIRSPKDTGFFCYRAIEVLRQFFIHEKGINDEKASWERLREVLNVERSEIDFIKDYADPVRHGGTRFISSKNVTEALKITWKIVDGFIVYASNGYTP